MFENPFSPIFGGKPSVFFGRDDILNRFDFAMVDQGSDDRAMFFTGTRGSGKTALLEQLSIRAASKKRTVIDLGPEDTIDQLVQELTTCERAKYGLLVTVDEVQKVPIEDMSSLCNAFQMASRKGHDIMLAVAGLPYAYPTITRHEGCTYLRRVSHEELGLFTWEETSAAFSKVFSGIRGLKISEDYIDMLNQSSFGHPYLMQLLGYHLLVQINEETPGKKHEVTQKETEEGIANALLAYERRALKPLLDELPESERKYLTAMSVCMDDDRLAMTSAIAKKLNTPQNKLSKIRANLIDNGIIAAPEHGKVMFCIPYLADYVKKDRSVPGTVAVARNRRV